MSTTSAGPTGLWGWLRRRASAQVPKEPEPGVLGSIYNFIMKYVFLPIYNWILLPTKNFFYNIEYKAYLKKALTMEFQNKKEAVILVSLILILATVIFLALLVFYRTGSPKTDHRFQEKVFNFAKDTKRKIKKIFVDKDRLQIFMAEGNAREEEENVLPAKGRWSASGLKKVSRVIQNYLKGLGSKEGKDVKYAAIIVDEKEEA